MLHELSSLSLESLLGLMAKFLSVFRLDVLLSEIKKIPNSSTQRAVKHSDIFYQNEAKSSKVVYFVQNEFERGQQPQDLLWAKEGQMLQGVLSTKRGHEILLSRSCTDENLWKCLFLQKIKQWELISRNIFQMNLFFISQNFCFLTRN